jgi:hypothetical protein
MSKYVMPDLIRHPVFSMDSGFRRNDEFIYLIAGAINHSGLEFSMDTIALALINSDFLRCKNLYAIMFICYISISRTIYCYTLRSTKLTITRTTSSQGILQNTVRIKFLDAVVIKISHIDVSGRINR